MGNRKQVVGLLLILAAVAMACSGPGSAVPGGILVGTRAPNFTLETWQGNPVSLSDYRGHVVLVNLWATWCTPCQAEIPDLEAMYRAHKADGFVVLGVNIRESRQEVQAFVQEFGITYPILLDPTGKLLNSYRVRGLPTSLLVDREGVIRARHLGVLNAHRLEEYLAPVLPGRIE